jgi:hypothetical protein
MRLEGLATMESLTKALSCENFQPSASPHSPIDAADRFVQATADEAGGTGTRTPGGLASAIAETALISYLSVQQASLPILMDLSLMRLQGLERPVSLFRWLQHGGNPAKPAASSSPLLSTRFSNPPQPPQSPPHRRRNIAPISMLEASEKNSSSSWSNSGASHISFRSESGSLALQNASYGVDHLSAKLKKPIFKCMRPPRRPGRVCMTKAGLKNHPAKICHAKGNGEWAQGKFFVYEAEFNEARRKNPAVALCNFRR